MSLLSDRFAFFSEDLSHLSEITSTKIAAIGIESVFIVYLNFLLLVLLIVSSIEETINSFLRPQAKRPDHPKKNLFRYIFLFIFGLKALISFPMAELFLFFVLTIAARMPIL